MICGHSGEARNLAEVALQRGFTDVRIVTWPLDLLATSGLPLKPLDGVLPTARASRWNGPEPVGDYKVPDGRYLAGHDRTPRRAVHRRRSDGLHVALPQPAHTCRRGGAAGGTLHRSAGSGCSPSRRRSAQTSPTWCDHVPATDASARPPRSLSAYLDSDLPVAVSDYTKELIISSAEEIDARHGTSFAERCRQRVAISYPAINTADYLDIRADRTAEVLSRRGLIARWLRALPVQAGSRQRRRRLDHRLHRQPGVQGTDPGDRRQRARGTRNCASRRLRRRHAWTGSASSTTSTTMRSRI